MSPKSIYHQRRITLLLAIFSLVMGGIILSLHSQTAAGLAQPTSTPCTATSVKLAPTFVPDGGSQPSSATSTPIVMSVPCPTSTRTLIASPGTRIPLVALGTATLTPTSTSISASATTTLAAVGDCTPAGAGTGGGLFGAYFNDSSVVDNYSRLSGVPVVTRIDTNINFDWNSTPPPAPLPNKYNFAVRWTGQIQAEYSGQYTFTTLSDDGVFLWVNGKQIISDWQDQPASTPVTSQPPLTFVAGQKYDIEFDYFANGQNFSSVNLTWNQPCNGISGNIPTARLYATKSPDTIGVFRGFSPNFSFYLKNANTSGNADYQAAFGASGDLPITGDWDGDGRDSMGVFRIINNQAWYFLSNDNVQTAFPDYSVNFAPAGITPTASDIPIAGRWRLGQKHDGIGLFRPSTGVFYLKNELTTGNGDYTAAIISPTATYVPLAGDWNGDGRDNPGIFNQATRTFYLSNDTSNILNANYQPVFGTSTTSTADLPFAGAWTGLASQGIGVYDNTVTAPGLTRLRIMPTSGITGDINISFGVAGDRPLAGHWPTVEEQLLTYGVELVDVNPAQKWAASEKLAILTGVRDTSIAFRKVTNPPDPLNVVFQRVMGMANQGHIIFRRDINQTGLSGICATNQLSVPRTVTCYGALTNGTGLVNKFTVVHELGHIFDYQSGSPNTGSPTPTPVAGATALHDRMNNGQPIVLDCPSIGPSGTVTPSALVMGVNAVVNPTATWTRGERGWGSGPAKNTSGGPLITNYQQDPLFIQGAVTVDLAVSEAAADTFLNWVYRNITVGSSANPCTDAVPGTPSGFVNSSWKTQTSNAATTGTPDPSRPGSKRYEWMNTQIPNIFSQHGW
ncbi:MAG: PA14 domain-containing protein [Chloroflexota bacterium]